MKQPTTAHARASINALKEVLGPVGCTFSYEPGGKHIKVVVDGPLGRRYFTMSRGAKARSTDSAQSFARQWARKYLETKTA